MRGVKIGLGAMAVVFAVIAIFGFRSSIFSGVVTDAETGRLLIMNIATTISVGATLASVISVVGLAIVHAIGARQS